MARVFSLECSRLGESTSRTRHIHACDLQVEERLRFYEEGVAPRKNASVMAEAMAQFKSDQGPAAEEEEGKKKKKDKVGLAQSGKAASNLSLAPISGAEEEARGGCTTS
jgi:hypothetical protein